MINDVAYLRSIIEKGLLEPDLDNLYRLLGLRNYRWRNMLCQNAIYSPLVGPLLALRPDNVASIETPSSENYDNDKLILSQNGAPNVGSPWYVPTVWPFTPEITVKYHTSHDLTVTYADNTWLCGCTIGNNAAGGGDQSLYVAWPTELNICGDIDLTENPYRYDFSMTFLTPADYPAAQVLGIVKSTNEIFDLFMDDDYAAAITNSVDTQETLAIIIAGLYKRLA